MGGGHVRARSLPAFPRPAWPHRPVAGQRQEQSHHEARPRAGHRVRAEPELRPGSRHLAQDGARRTLRPGCGMTRGRHRRPRRIARSVVSGHNAETRAGAAAAAGDSISVAAWTIVSRLTGVAKFAAIGAVLGPTFFGNTYQFTNSLPNLVYYGFLAGSLFSSLLVPALVRHIDAGNRPASERVAGGFLGMTLILLLAITPLAITLGPLVLKFAALGGGHQVLGAAQERVGRLLIIMFIPLVFANRLPGGVVAFQIALNFYYLAIALGATPVALSLLPRLSRMHMDTGVF